MENYVKYIIKKWGKLNLEIKIVKKESESVREKN